ncbi:MAG TPA: AAA family ATPase, partial [Spirochaetia bacterium]|nr:AAA family ATPase [Spirochaetia bacterium]
RSGRRPPEVVTQATFSLSAEDCAEMEKEYPGALTGSEMVLCKGYDNALHADLQVDTAAVMNALLSRAGSPRRLSKAKTLTLSALATALEGDGHAEIRGTLDEMQKRGIAGYLAEKYLMARVPRFMYFDEFYQMAGHVNIEGLLDRQRNGRLLESDYPLLGLIDLARLDLQEITNPARALERDNRLEGASNHLTDTIMHYWSQNAALEMRFDIRPALPNDPEGMRCGTNLWCHVYNSRQKVCTLLGTRSRGFIWFFSFLAWFSQHKRMGVPLILLLDEPAIYLHGTAQRDLLRYLEDESRAGLQVIYTTQSPYMIDARRFDRVRIVEDRAALEKQPASSRTGTVVGTDATQAAEGSVLPLTGALAEGMYSDLLPGKNLLLVGDIADMLFCGTMSSLLVAGGALGLDPAWTIAPMGGSQRMAAFVQLARSQARGLAEGSALFSRSALSGMDSAITDGLLQRQRMFLYGSFVGREDAEVEDMFDPEFYLSLVNDEYHDILMRPIRRK